MLFVLIHKIGDTLANLTLRLLFGDLRFTNDEIAFYDVFIGFIAFLVGIFVGGALYARAGMKQAVLVSLVLMAVSNFSFAALAAAGHSNLGLAGAIGFENFASGIGGVTVVAYSRRCATCDSRPRSTRCSRRSRASRAVPYRHDRRRAHRHDGLRKLLPVDDGDRVPRCDLVLVHDAVGSRRSVESGQLARKPRDDASRPKDAEPSLTASPRSQTPPSVESATLAAPTDAASHYRFSIFYLTIFDK